MATICSTGRSRFARTYEGLKHHPTPGRDRPGAGFARTYEGLKLQLPFQCGYPHAGFARTYEGLKR